MPFAKKECVLRVPLYSKLHDYHISIPATTLHINSKQTRTRRLLTPQNEKQGKARAWEKTGVEKQTARLRAQHICTSWWAERLHKLD